jgi:hypothetical protein
MSYLGWILSLWFLLVPQARIPGPGGKVTASGGSGACVSDNFIGANQNPIASPWHIPTGSRAIQIKNDLAQGTSASPNENSAFCTGSSSAPNNQYSEVTIGSVANDDFAGPAIRMSNGPTYYVAWARPSADLIYLYKLVNGSFTQMTYFSGTVTVGTKVRLRASGSTLTVSVNGTDVGSHSDSAISSGQYGMSIYVTTSSNDLSFSSWSGGAN